MNENEKAARKILVVEDSETQMEVLSRLLTGAGYQVFKARTGLEGFTTARETLPDLIISDILMPEMDGYQFCRKVKDDESLKAIPVVLLTQLDRTEEVIMGLQAGADNYITKPYEEEFLLSKIKSILINPIGFTNNPEGKRVDFNIEGKQYSVTSGRGQTVAFLLTTYENVVRRNLELYRIQGELERTNEHLEHKVNLRTAALAGEMAERKQLAVDLLRRNRELSALYSIYKAAEEKQSTREMLEAVLRTICNLQEVTMGTVYILEQDKETLTEYSSIGISENELKCLASIKVGEGLAGTVAQAMKPVVMKLKDYPTQRLAPVIAGLGVKTMVGIPILSGKELVGAMSFGSKNERTFFQEDLNLFMAIGRQIGDMINASRLYQQLRESEEKFQTIARVAADAIIHIDGKGIIAYWNAAAETSFGYTKEEVMGKDVRIIIPERNRALHIIGLENFRNTGTGEILGRHVEVSGLRKDGVEVPLELAVSGFLLNGEWNAVGIVRDITERKQWEKSLQESTGKTEVAMVELKKAQDGLIRSEKLAALGHLSAGVAHEIKNPLNIISTSAQLLLMEETMAQEAKEHCKTILEQVARATKISDNLRDFAKVRKPEKKEFDLNDLLAKTVSLVEYEMRLDNIEFNLELCPSAVINGDRDQLAQVFLNIINNAADSMKEKQAMAGREKLRETGWKGEISIKTYGDDPCMAVEFSDTGNGIPADAIKNIFDPFFSTKGEQKGTGLGLSIAFGIMENHGGTIQAKSKEGEGTIFTLKFPATENMDNPDDL